ncbi:acyl-[acyl-carrier-protein] thioesterase [Mediterraneibacter glycyrrhizinilyticus]|uniref:acyl-[acyl-carrier-protein] thioesterase n=1 Tax=Mediterraneibacter glycyrrhizinilyticus TaxID=342942 RepID=UPI0025A4601B|nr:acyl-ACP thioesterase domain-containing protein [Mediterraneibacter glycyrrhizinilyticus]MDM8125161.1 thioesterase [Mediterraneibacter glycyrrhizinilyticus]
MAESVMTLEAKSKGRYEFDGRVRYSEIDHRGTMTLPALINYFQDASTFQSEAIGLGMDRLKHDKKAWVLSYWQVIVERYPQMCEKITTGTFATEFKGLYGNRNFYMKDGSGELIARANSIWAFMDLEKGRPVRPTAEHIDPYGTCEPLDMPYEERKIALPEQSEAGEPFPVRKYHIDTNEHVNNCQYVQMALEMVPGDIQVRQLRVDYKKSAVLGDMIYPRMTAEQERTVVELCDADGKPYAIVEMK